MSITPRLLPFTRSLLDLVVAEFGADAPAVSQPLDKQELVQFLGRSKDTDTSPLATIKRRAAKQNRTAELAPEDHAVLAWVCEAFSDWEERYPLEQPLRDQLHRMLPLAVAMALHDDDFLFPGVHPLHQLLDALQAGAVGWQVRLDRAGQMLEQRVERSVDKALEWFDNQQVDIEAITRELTAANERDSARAQRMVQRLEETEMARLRTLTARRDAALFINKGLEEFELPSAIGEFLKGPWYDSAQLVLVKFGKDSDEWAQMRRTTRHLMESVQDRTNISEAQLDRLEQMLRRLPSELRRWLISLEHDSDETDGAIGLVEYAHLRLQHGQDIQRSLVETLEIESQGEREDEDDELRSKTGEWYQFEDDEGELRAQLVLQLENSSHLLFANFVGLKALDLRRETFVQRLEDGFAHHLPNRSSFSLSLAAAVGIDDDEDYRGFHDPDYQPPGREPRPAPAETTVAEDSERSFAGGSGPDVSEAQTWDSDLPPLGGAVQDESPTRMEEPEAEEVEEIDPILVPPEDAETEITLDIDLAPGEAPTGAALAIAPADAAPTAAPMDPAPSPPPAPTPPPAEPAPAVSIPAPEPSPSQAPPAPTPPSPPPQPVAAPIPPGPPPTAVVPPAPEPPPSEPVLRSPPEEPSQAPEPPAQPVVPEPAPAPVAPAEPPPPREAAPPEPPPRAPSEPPPPPRPEPEPVTPAPQAPPAAGGTATREVDVPMGAWMGFHDGETPIMAKLAVYDPRRDNYIFVNRMGIALRELNRAELLRLMDEGLVDILETRSYFRDEVKRARGEEQ